MRGHQSTTEEDLKANNMSNETKLFQVSVKDINHLVKKHKEIVGYIETSAKDNPEDPAKVFECAAEAILHGNKSRHNAGCIGLRKMMNVCCFNCCC